jgi:hypothetical protein
MIDQSIALVVQSLVGKLPSFFLGSSQIGSQQQQQQDVLLKRFLLHHLFGIFNLYFVLYIG